MFTSDIINMDTIHTKYVLIISQVLTEKRFVDQGDIHIVLFQLLRQGTITTLLPPIAIHTTFIVVTSRHKATVHGQFTFIVMDLLQLCRGGLELQRWILMKPQVI